MRLKIRAVLCGDKGARLTNPIRVDASRPGQGVVAACHVGRGARRRDRGRQRAPPAQALLVAHDARLPVSAGPLLVGGADERYSCVVVPR